MAVGKRNTNPIVKYVLIFVSGLFLFVMLVLPLIVVVVNALKDGWTVYRQSITDIYAIKALGLTLLASVSAVAVNTVFGLFASYLLSKFYFRGRQVLAALIDIPFSISPVIAGLVFILTFGNIGWMGGFLKAHHIKIVFAVPGDSCHNICHISLCVPRAVPGDERLWKRRGGSGGIDGGKGIHDLSEDYLPPCQMGVAVRDDSVRGKGDGGIWSRVCHIRAFAGQDQYPPSPCGDSLQ